MLRKRDDARTIQEVIERNTKMTAMEFLNPDPMPYIHNLKNTAECILKHKNESFTIVGDFDVDGICATSIMYHALNKIGIEAKTRLPHRFTEGYGLSNKIIDEIDSGVVITVDNGIAAYDAIQKAKEKGLTVIITDHHLAPVKDEKRILPPADFIVDPNADDDSDYKEYCGAAIAYRLAQELCSNEDLTDLLVLASIATVSDVMKLYGANRYIVKEGLKAINAGKGPVGLRMLLESIHLTEHITEDDYGFKLGPIFNASGRLYDNGAERVLEVLKTETLTKETDALVNELVAANEQRKENVKSMYPIAEKLAKGERPIVIYHPSFGEGIIGILAGNLSEKYQCPVIVFTKTEQGTLKGSGRSVPGINLKCVLDKISNTMIKYGGHAGAAGLSIKAGTLNAFKKAFVDACGVIPPISTDIEYDLELKPQDFERYIAQMQIFGPFGEGNPKPIFHIWYSSNGSYSRIGNGEHFRIKGNSLTLLGFDLAKKYEAAGMPKNIDCVGYPQVHMYNGNAYNQFELIGFKERESA